MPSNLTTPLQPQFSVAKQPHDATATSILSCQATSLRHCNQIHSCQPTSLRHCNLNSQLPSNLTSPLQPQFTVAKQPHYATAIKFTVAKQPHYATAIKFTVAKQPHYANATSIISYQTTPRRHCNQIHSCQATSLRHCNLNSQLPSNLTTPLQAQFSVAKQPHYATAISILSCQVTSLRHCNRIHSCQATSLRHCNLNSKLPSNLTTSLHPQLSVAKQPHYVTAIKFSVAKQPHYATATSILSCQATSLRHCNLNSQLPSNHTTPPQPQLTVAEQPH